MRNVEQIKTGKSDSVVAETESTHPAFGQIVVTRWQGCNQSLYGSDFIHNNGITISVHRSQLSRGLSRDWYHHDLKPIVELHLSEAQWASFVSSFGQGSGTPCTLTYTERDGILPRIPDPESRIEQFKAEADERMQRATDALKKLRDEVSELGLPVRKAAAVQDFVDTALRELRANLPFVAQQFGEYAEETVEKAKAEIHGYMQSVIARAGLEALGATVTPLLLEGSQGDE